MKYEGIPRRKKLSEEVKAFPTFAKIMRGEKVEKKKPRKKPVRKSDKNIMAEKKLEKDMIIMLRGMRLDAYKTGEGAMYNGQYCEVGVADITVKGSPFKIFYIEVKMPGKKQRNTQTDAEERCRQQGIGYYVCTTLLEARAVAMEEIG